MPRNQLLALLAALVMIDDTIAGAIPKKPAEYIKRARILLAEADTPEAHRPGALPRGPRRWGEEVR
jgi:hypothetical protein